MRGISPGTPSPKWHCPASHPMSAQLFKRLALRGDGVPERGRPIAAVDVVFAHLKNNFGHGGQCAEGGAGLNSRSEANGGGDPSMFGILEPESWSRKTEDLGGWVHPSFRLSTGSDSHVHAATLRLTSRVRRRAEPAIRHGRPHLQRRGLRQVPFQQFSFRRQFSRPSPQLARQLFQYFLPHRLVHGARLLRTTALPSLSETCLSIPAISGGALFFRTCDQLVAMDAKP